MAEKQVIRLSPTLASDAQYRQFADIPSAHLSEDRIIELMPGEYDEVVNINVNGITVTGRGHKDEVIVNGMQFSNASSGVLRFHNLTIRGTNNIQQATYGALQILGHDSTVSTKLDNVVLSNANVGVMSHGSGTITATYCDFSGVDKAMRANAGMTIKFCHLSANAYAEGNNAQIQAVTVLGGYGAGGNGAITTETVVAAIS